MHIHIPWYTWYIHIHIHVSSQFSLPKMRMATRGPGTMALVLWPALRRHSATTLPALSGGHRAAMLLTVPLDACSRRTRPRIPSQYVKNNTRGGHDGIQGGAPIAAAGLRMGGRRRSSRQEIAFDPLACTRDCSEDMGGRRVVRCEDSGGQMSCNEKGGSDGATFEEGNGCWLGSPSP